MGYKIEIKGAEVINEAINFINDVFSKIDSGFYPEIDQVIAFINVLNDIEKAIKRGTELSKILELLRKYLEDLIRWQPESDRRKIMSQFQQIIQRQK